MLGHGGVTSLTPVTESPDSKLARDPPGPGLRFEERVTFQNSAQHPVHQLRQVQGRQIHRPRRQLWKRRGLVCNVRADVPPLWTLSELPTPIVPHAGRREREEERQLVSSAGDSSSVHCDQLE